MHFESKKIFIVAGGTGGHIFPGLAVAKELIANNCIVSWIGTTEGLEATIIPKYNIPLYFIKITGFRGKNIITKLLVPWKILLALWQSIRLIAKHKPDVVLGMGGFVTGPMGIAAWMLRKKLVIHEQNTIAGTSNKILSFFADLVLESFPNSFYKNKIKKNKIILTGLPIREDLLKIKKTNKNNNILNILILGGSRGARFLNQTVPQALVDLTNINITHQTGIKEFDDTKVIYNKYFSNNNYKLTPFIDDMVNAYQHADLVICRAGAATIFEIMAVGVAAILIPLPFAIDDHQTKNALYLANNNAGILLKQENTTIDRLRNLILDLINNKEKIKVYSGAAGKLYSNDQNSCGCIVKLL